MSAPESSATSPATLWPSITGYMPARVIHVAAELGIADLLAAEAKTADALAQEIDTAPVPLRRFCALSQASAWSKNSRLGALL